ncbi:hypothetical protein CKA32_002044 [Geitlerinema sp. FC II]|nr:hypothetical protein CKA32_002044 [Geitlerinema sp. FC II]
MNDLNCKTLMAVSNKNDTNLNFKYWFYLTQKAPLCVLCASVVKTS